MAVTWTNIESRSTMCDCGLNLSHVTVQQI